jgi:ElaB/YqjD/DUF883 family membrane-anchored ribosome-binding protein
MSRKRKNGSNGHGVQARLNALRDDLDALQEDMRGLVNDAGGAASQQVQGVMTEAVHSAQDMADRVGDWGNDNLDVVRETVRSRPFVACALSVGAGALIGALLLR